MPEDPKEDGDEPAGEGQRKKETKVKKTASVIKIERLNKLLAENSRGRTIHNRPINEVNEKLVKKMNVNHFEPIRKDEESGSPLKNAKKFESEAEKFDRAAASCVIQSKHTRNKQNSLFMDTRVFNQSKNEYLEKLSMPGALEEVDALEESPFDEKKKKYNNNYTEIKSHKKI